jgi:formiminotetrahydrofolate cyclodeaminase
MAKSQRISVLITDGTRELLDSIAVRSPAPVPQAAVCQVALEIGLKQMCAELARDKKGKLR